MPDLEDAPLHLLEAERVDEPLQAGAQLVVAVAGLLEHTQDRLDRGQQVFAGGELLERQRRVRVGAEAAGDVDAEAALDLAVRQRARHGDHADVVEHRLAAVGRAAGEVDLELARQALAERVAHEVLERRLRPLRDVEHLLRAGAGEVAALDVAHGVAARLAAGEPDRCEVLHHVGDVVQLHEVELDVLARRDVAPAAAVAVGDVAHHLELLGRHRSVRHLDADHLIGAALALAVDAVVEAEHAEHVLGHLARLVAAELLAELGDVGHLLGVPLVTRLDRDQWRRRQGDRASIRGAS